MVYKGGVFFMPTYANVYMNGGQNYRVKCDEDELLELIENTNELVEIVENIYINPKEVSSVEFEHKLIDW